MKQLKQTHDISALVLSGGLSRRMQGVDKGLMKLAGKPMIQYLLDSLNSHINNVFISTNSSNPTYKNFGYPLVSDILTGSLGPLAGIHAGLHACNTQYLLVTPCDCPFLNTQLSERLEKSLVDQSARIAVAHDGERIQNTFVLIDTQLVDSLSSYLNRGGRRLITWLKEENAIEVDCSDHKEGFTNINTLSELEIAEQALTATK